MLLKDEEAKQLGRATENVLRHYPIDMTQKAMDFMALGMAIVTIEGPRVMLVVQHKNHPVAVPAQSPKVAAQ